MTEEIKDQELAKEAVQREETAEENPVSTPETPAEQTTSSSDDRPETARREPRGHYRQQREPRGGGKDESGQKFPKFKRKICKFCYDSKLEIDYKKSDILERFITDRGKILPRRVTGTCAKHQRRIAVEIKKARIIALLPFVEK